MSITTSPIYIIAFLFVFACFIALQIYLSKQKSRMLGLILPIACFLPALLVTIAAADFSFTATGSYIQLTYTRLGETQTVKFDTSEEMQAHMDSLDENSEIQDFSTVTGHGNKAQYAWTVVILFFVASIPAVVLLCIYLGFLRWQKPCETVKEL